MELGDLIVVEVVIVAVAVAVVILIERIVKYLKYFESLSWTVCVLICQCSEFSALFKGLLRT